MAPPLSDLFRRFLNLKRSSTPISQCHLTFHKSKLTARTDTSASVNSAVIGGHNNLHTSNEGETFNGPMYGGFQGGRGNINTINNNFGASASRFLYPDTDHCGSRSICATPETALQVHASCQPTFHWTWPDSRPPQRSLRPSRPRC